MKSPWKQRGGEQPAHNRTGSCSLLHLPHPAGSEQGGRLCRKGQDGGQALSRAEDLTLPWLGCPSLGWWEVLGHAGPIRGLVLSPGRGKGLGRKRGLCPEVEGETTRA